MVRLVTTNTKLIFALMLLCCNMPGQQQMKLDEPVYE